MKRLKKPEQLNMSIYNYPAETKHSLSNPPLAPNPTPNKPHSWHILLDIQDTPEWAGAVLSYLNTLKQHLPRKSVKALWSSKEVETLTPGMTIRLMPPRHARDLRVELKLNQQAVETASFHSFIAALLLEEDEQHNGGDQ